MTPMTRQRDVVRVRPEQGRDGWTGRSCGGPLGMVCYGRETQGAEFSAFFPLT